MKKILIFTIILILCSCISENQKKYENFKIYLQDKFSTIANNDNNAIFVVEPACFTCAKNVLEMLKDIKSDQLIILSIGSITKENEDSLNLIAGKRKLYFDKSLNILKYQVDIEKGLFIHVKDEKCIFYKSISNYDSITVKYINQNL